MKRPVFLLVAILGLVAGPAGAQILPGKHYIIPHVGTFFARNELLRDGAIYPTPRVSDPFNPVITDIALDPGLGAGLRWAYGLTRRLSVEAEFGGTLSIAAIRQLEIKPDTQPGDQPQYETTTMDARIHHYGLGLTYLIGPWQKATPYFTFGAYEHVLNLRQKGVVDPDPVRDRAIMAGLGLLLPATDRLGIRVELRNFMYNFRFDNQFVDPVQSRNLITDRPDFINTTSIAGTKFQNDLNLSLAFMVRLF